MRHLLSLRADCNESVMKCNRFTVLRGGGGGGRTRVLEQGLDRFYKFVRANIVGMRVVARLTPHP